MSSRPLPLHVDASTGGVVDGAGEDVFVNGFFSVCSPGQGQSAAYAMRDDLLHRYNAHDSLVAALDALTRRYCELVDSGDCGFWDSTKDEDVIAARVALSLARPTQEKSNG